MEEGDGLMMFVLKVLYLYCNYKAYVQEERKRFYVSLANSINNYLQEGTL